MKKYISRAVKWFAFFAIISGVMLVTGIILIVANSSNIGLQIGLTMGGGLMGVLFLLCFLVEKSRWLTIDRNEIVLSR